MPSIILECPHCGAEKVGFTIVFQQLATLLPSHIAQRWRTLLLCSNCEEGVIAVFDKPRSLPVHPQGQSPQSCSGDPRKFDWVLFRTFPSPSPSRCPSHTPEDLERIFLQASNALKRGDPDASGAMSRKVIDVSTQKLLMELLPEDCAQYRTIQARIDALAKAARLTPNLKSWAHEVRLGGNDATHDTDPFKPEEAEELLAFAELYLTYVYSLPGHLSERRTKAGHAAT